VCIWFPTYTFLISVPSKWWEFLRLIAVRRTRRVRRMTNDVKRTRRVFRNETEHTWLVCPKKFSIPTQHTQFTVIFTCKNHCWVRQWNWAILASTRNKIDSTQLVRWASLRVLAKYTQWCNFCPNSVFSRPRPNLFLFLNYQTRWVWMSKKPSHATVPLN